MSPIDRRRFVTGSIAVTLAGCSAAARAEPGAPRIEMQPDLGDDQFAQAGSGGTFAALDLAGNRIVVSDCARAEQGYLPASTFKIPNSLIALETEVVTDADNQKFPWDGRVREFESWNQDHTLRSAFKASAVPVYQEIAREIGPERMQHDVDAFDYGNRDIGGAAIDTFWLDGRLRISCFQQIDFLRKLYLSELPLSKRSQEIVKDIMELDRSELGTLRGKTGAVGIGVAPDSKATLGWLVGWLEQGSKPYIFAMNIDVRDQRQLAARLPIAKALLKQAMAL